MKETVVGLCGYSVTVKLVNYDWQFISHLLDAVFIQH